MTKLKFKSDILKSIFCISFLSLYIYIIHTYIYVYIYIYIYIYYVSFINKYLKNYELDIIKKIYIDYKKKIVKDIKMFLNKKKKRIDNIASQKNLSTMKIKILLSIEKILKN